ncbi:hypothetical protein [Lysobacter sp. 1R34A]|uniref:hypothetical protein n=1 Tax=Lysobacter sp. 1R34A TaxID=3445786 RepID=UPI003EEA08AE
MTSQSIPKGPAADELRNAINWQAAFPNYVFSEGKLQGFFIIGAGIFDTRNFLEFMLGENLRTNGTPISVLVRLREQPERDLFFSVSNADEIKDLRLHVTQGPFEIFGSIIVVSGEPKWVAYEDVDEHFAILAVFDASTFERWSAKESGVFDYVISEDQVSEKLQADEWVGWESDFLKKIIESYGGGQK